MLERIVERMSSLVPRRHRELVRGMVTELDSIVDPAERTRFALGAIAAIARLALFGHGRSSVSVGEATDGANHGGPAMSNLTTRQLLRRLATPFAVSLVALTMPLLARRVEPWAERLSARGAPDTALGEVLLFAIPSAFALTIPMAVFLAVAWVFSRLGAEGVIAAARRERGGVRRLMIPVLGAAAVVAALTVVSNTEILPRANARLVEVLVGAPGAQTDRTMTLGELREAARSARIGTEAEAGVLVARYGVEIHKKLAISTASVILALVAAAMAIRFPLAGLKLVLGASGLVFALYWLSLVGGEELADRQLLSPLVAMWMANALLFAVALLLMPRPSSPDPSHGGQALAVDG